MTKASGFIYFEENDVIDILINIEKPIMESRLIRLLKTEYNYNIPSSCNMFDLHFSLFNCLYRVKQKMGVLDYYLHLDPMRIRLIKIVNGCCHYEAEKGNFCGKKKENDFYCNEHGKTSLNGEIYSLIMQEFYLNEDNISFKQSKTFQKILKGYTSYALKPGIVKEALEFFEIKNPNKKLIKKKYHQLAKKYHPDLSSQSQNKMKMVNYYYNVLSEIFSM